MCGLKNKVQSKRNYGWVIITLIKMLLKFVLVEGSKILIKFPGHRKVHNPWLKINNLSSTELT